jgi:hypothetical protein
VSDVITGSKEGIDFTSDIQRMRIKDKSERAAVSQPVDSDVDQRVSVEHSEDTRLQQSRIELLRELQEIDNKQRVIGQHVKHRKALNTEWKVAATVPLNKNTTDNMNFVRKNTVIAADSINANHDYISMISEEAPKIKESTPHASRKSGFKVDSPFMESVYLSTQGSAIHNKMKENGIIDYSGHINLSMNNSPIITNQTPYFVKPRVKIPTFSGRYEKLSPFQFIMEFERYARAQGMHPYHIMHRDMPCALLDDALSCWDFNEGFPTWEEFIDRFMIEFCSVNYQQELWKQLESRTQDRDESLTSFIRTINNYYRFLNIPVPDTVKVQRVLDQIHPMYRKYTCGQYYANLQELAEAAVKIQDVVLKEKMYKPPPDPADCAVLNLAYNRRNYKYLRDDNIPYSRGSSSERGVSLWALDPYRGKIYTERPRYSQDRGRFNQQQDKKVTERSGESSRERSQERSPHTSTEKINNADVSRVSFDKMRCFLCDSAEH